MGKILPLQVIAIPLAAGVGPASRRLQPVLSHCTAMHMLASPCKESGYMPCCSRVPEPACRSQTLPLGAAGIRLVEEPALRHGMAKHGTGHLLEQ